MYASIPSPFEAKGMVSIIYVFRYTTRNILLQSKCNWILCFFRFYFRPTYPNFIKFILTYQASAGGSKLPYVMPKIKLKMKRFMDKKKVVLAPVCNMIQNSAIW